MARPPSRPDRAQSPDESEDAKDASTDELPPGSLDGLNPADPGVRLLGRQLAEVDPKELLLVHCGDLPGVQPGALRLIMDVRERTGSVHRCVPDVGAEPPAIEGPGFAAAAVWPRAHLGKDFSERCLAIGAMHLREGGRLYCAVRKQKGGKSLARTMKALLGESAVSVEARDHGYHLWVGERGPDFNAELAAELCARRYEIRNPLLVGVDGPLVLHSRPGVFSRRELDTGTGALLAVASALADVEPVAPRRILDLCAGIGPLSLWAAAHWPTARVVAVESNLRACALLEENAAENGLAARVVVRAHDGLPEDLDLGGGFDLALINPPTHADSKSLRRLLDLRGELTPGGRLLVVVKRPDRAIELLTSLGAELAGGERDGFVVLQARWAT